jgi:hypothetical protein
MHCPATSKDLTAASTFKRLEEVESLSDLSSFSMSAFDPQPSTASSKLCVSKAAPSSFYQIATNNERISTCQMNLGSFGLAVKSCRKIFNLSGSQQLSKRVYLSKCVNMHLAAFVLI